MHSNVSYLRIRPCDSDNEIYLNSRLKEGTTTFLVNNNFNFEIIHKKGFQTISENKEHKAFMWKIEDENWKNFKDVDSRRLVYLYKGNKETALEIFTRLKPRIVQINKNIDIDFILSNGPKYNHLISKYVDTVDEAIKAINLGVTDLLLRDWSLEQIKELKSEVAVNLYERTLLSPFLSVNEARDILNKDEFTNFLLNKDVRGFKRKKIDWFPGSGKNIPSMFNFVFNTLFKTSGKYINKIAEYANELNFKINGNQVSFVKNRNINYTNQCYYKCGFCGFSKGPKSFDLKEKPYNLNPLEVVKRTKEAYDSGASEVCLQGGIHPDYTGNFYLNLVKEIKKEVPDIHIHGFTPLEIWQGAETINKSIEDYLKLLKDAGLNTLPGTAAEILDDRIRKYLCPDKITSQQWGYVMEVAHSIGINSTATIMFGHIDDIESWVNHYSLIKNIQNKTNGFTEIVPLPFVHMGSPIYIQGKSMPGPTWDEIVLVHSLARIYFHKYIDNIQASWVKLGHDGATKLLNAGVNDLGGTLINENISRASGASHGQETTDKEFIEIILKANKKPFLRNTLYTNMIEINDSIKEKNVIKL